MDIKYDYFLKTNKNKKLGCQESCISLIAGFLNIDYYMLFCDSLQFICENLDDSEKCINNYTYRCLENHEESINFSLLKIINGIKVIKHVCSDNKKIISFIKNNNLERNSPIILPIDNYFCYWTPYFMKLHGQHHILVLGVNNLNDLFLCLDPYYAPDKIVDIKYDSLQYKTEVIFYELQICKTERLSQTTLNILLNAIEKYRMRLINDNYLGILIKFVNRFYLDARENIHTTDYHLQNLPLLRHFKVIENDRINYSIFLSGLYNDYNLNTTDLINECHELSKMWFSFRTIILKYTLKDDYETLIDKAKTILNNILINERELCKSLISLFESKMSSII